MTLDSFAPDALRVLLFEDNAMDAALIKKFLRTAGVRAAHIYEADTIPSALHLLRREHIDLCLADYYLRPHTGFDLMDEARRGDVDVPFIVVTALDERRVDELALARGAYGFLVKGELTVEGLERSIRYALTHHRQVARLNRAASSDPLTGLANRQAFLERLTKVVVENAGRAGMVGVALFNLNGTRFINEAFGFKAGDDILRTVGQRLETAKRDGDTLARVGGDEFGVIMTDFLLAPQALALARALADAISGPIALGDGEHIITMAGGVASQAVGGHDAADDIAERLVHQASQAMVTAKHATRMGTVSHVAFAHLH